MTAHLPQPLFGIVIPPRPALTIEMIAWEVSAYTGIKMADMKGSRRTANVVLARHMAWWLCRELTERSYPQIAMKFGGRDHTTIISGKRRIDKQRLIDSRLSDALSALKDKLTDPPEAGL